MDRETGRGPAASVDRRRGPARPAPAPSGHRTAGPGRPRQRRYVEPGPGRGRAGRQRRRPQPVARRGRARSHDHHPAGRGCLPADRARGGAAIAYATRAAMAAQRPVIETLSLNGAADGTIARLVPDPVWPAGRGGGAGAAGAIAAAALLVAGLRGLGGPRTASARPCPWPGATCGCSRHARFLAASVAVVAARITALASLRRRR